MKKFIDNKDLWKGATNLIKPIYDKELKKVSDKNNRRIIKLCCILRASLSLTTCKEYKTGVTYELKSFKQAAWCVGFISSHLEELGKNQKLFMRKINYVLKELFGKKLANKYLEELGDNQYKEYIQMGIVAERNYFSDYKIPPIIFEGNNINLSIVIN